MADKGINEKVDTGVWGDVSKKIQENFINGYFSKGIIEGINDVGKLLSEHFPIKPDDVNELTNNVVIPK